MTRRELRSVYDFVRDTRAELRDETREHLRHAVKAIGWALVACTLAALVIWSWFSTARDAIRRADEAL